MQADKLEIVVRAAGLWAAGDAQASDESMILIEVPVELKRCGMAVRLIARIPGESRMTRPDPKLAAIVAKAHDWFARLSSGRRDSVGAIAREERVTSSYVTRVVHLAFLAPDIVQRILRGDHPLELNAERLIRIVPLPPAWGEQRALLAMAD